jgi:cardiolipin synthase A/B
MAAFSHPSSVAMEPTLSLVAEVTVSETFMVLAMIAIVLQSIYILVGLFGKGPKYQIKRNDPGALDDDHFLEMLESLSDAQSNPHTAVEVFANGENFYEAELEAIRNARVSINIEAYIFQKGKVMSRFVEALTAKAREGVEVRLVLDGLGSASTSEEDLKSLMDAGGQVAFYHSLRFGSIPNYNNRTHRELMIVDGKIAFIGGAGVGDHWMISTEKNRRWRDTMVRVEGDAVTNLQSTFAENWLESCDELLTGVKFFPKCEEKGESVAMVVNSTPSAGGSTRARILFQLLLASAQESIHITTPYFLPDHSMCEELKRAQKRGVEVTILVPGKHNDHLLTRSSSRMAYGRLLPHGIRIYEYLPSMLHAKILLIDSKWSVLGSTNFDNRSFGINDEVNIAIRDERVNARLEEDFQHDLSESKEISYAEWKRRPIPERGPELLGWILERQQ